MIPGTEKQASTWALVPLKSPERAKTRLADVLTARQRLRLFFELAERVIRALQTARGIDVVAVVTASPDVATFASALGAVSVLQSADIGMSAALDSAVRQLQTMKPERVLMLPGDLPLISTDAVESLIAAAGSAPSMVIVPDRHRVGTNALLCSPPHAITPCFGGHSFERHLSAAAAAGISAHVLEIDALALDLDCVDDLERLRQHGGPLAERVFELLSRPDTDMPADDRYPAWAE